ncbi:MAG: cation-transporting P-type ATPase [Chromatiales bacterium]|nr:cation-transporting P-type ATPase [Chromatiales bacterium]
MVTQGVQQRWHARPAREACAELQTTAAGLTSDEAQARLRSGGPNRLPEPPRQSAAMRFLLQFHNILIYVLLGAAVITAVLEHMVDTVVILAVVIANAIIGFLQEGKAEQAMAAIRQMLAPRAAVMRSGERRTVPGEDLVPGDIVLLEAGDRVPADLRLLTVHGLQVQEAILTGESLPVEKQIEEVAGDAALGDRFCMAYSGTLVAGGQARGIVVATGAGTEIGRISGMLSGVETLTTPLVRQMDVFARWLTILILLCSAILLAFGYFVEHYDFGEMFMVVVGLAVAAIPEGLPAVMTITLAIGVHAMARRNAIVRRLPAIETLGSVSVICTDKTGTLTRNEMAVGSLVTHAGVFPVTGAGYAPVGEIAVGEVAVAGHEGTGNGQPLLVEMARTATLCSDAELREHGGDWSVEGDPMEGALLAFAGKTGLDTSVERRTWTRTDAIAFDARHRFMASLNHDHEGHALILVKGAPERILEMCNAQRTTSGGAESLNVAYWQQQAEAIAAAGQRVLALALKPVPPEHTVLEHADVEGSLVLLGMVGLVDPPRPEAIAAVAECQDAGIRVKMITGDHAGTAAAIGRQIGLQNPGMVLTGAELDGMTDATLAAAVLQTDIFARTSPEHKLRLVMALQSHGMTVAMTGDGVNDAPALKRADAGIAMGRKGSEAAKEAAELVLADDNFASIVAAVREGRTVYDNIRKVISWTLPTNAGEAATIIVALIFGMTLPVTPVQILWVNLVTATTLGIALAFEPTEDNTMRRPPRPPGEPLLTSGLAWHIVLVAILFVCGVFGIYSYALDRGYPLELARTIALNTLVVMEIFHLFFIRNIYGTSLTWKAVRGTRVVWTMVITVTAAQFAITYLPAMQAIFGTRPVPLLDGLLIVGIGVLLFAIIEIEKQIRLRLVRPV